MHRPPDHFGGWRAGVDKFAKQDQRHLRRPERGMIGADPLDQLREQVVTTVNVADRINSPARRHRITGSDFGLRIVLAFPETVKRNHYIVTRLSTTVGRRARPIRPYPPVGTGRPSLKER